LLGFLVILPLTFDRHREWDKFLNEKQNPQTQVLWYMATDTWDLRCGKQMPSLKGTAAI